MTVTPTGRVVRTASGADLVIDRLFSVSAEQMWAAVTESDRTAAWFGPWTGTGSAGNAIRVQMVFEEGEPWMDMTIEVCEAPSRYVVSSTDDFGSWLMEVQVAADGDGSRVRLIQHLDAAAAALAVDTGPGWEYYLDLLVAAQSGDPRPRFDDYLALKGHYESEVARLAGDS
ncbi:SRPBCC family protein [Rhodococcus sp. Q]|uniref:SRPBCC family protein n=1 Tax=Rhodococcus sp. Q TaxID=2502252 RepID=UPI0010F98341|nr:SRPBCC family protein [Rhodococcus sp. Q]